jgi:RimJ/RimL family protein N-acetyltransferase
VSPFPLQLAESHLVKWVKTYQLELSCDGFLEDEEALLKYCQNVITTCPTWAVVVDDKILGALWIDQGDYPSSVGFHFVSSPRAFGFGIMERASKMVIEQIFTQAPQVLHISANLFDSNRSAKAFLSRIGFRQIGLFTTFATRKGTPLDLALFEYVRS